MLRKYKGPLILFVSGLLVIATAGYVIHTRQQAAANNVPAPMPTVVPAHHKHSPSHKHSAKPSHKPSARPVHHYVRPVPKQFTGHKPKNIIIPVKHAPKNPPPPVGATMRWHCMPMHTTFIEHSLYGLRNDIWGGAKGCMGNVGWGPNFLLAHDTDNAMGPENLSYQNIFYGCEWWSCTAGTVLPKPLNKLKCLRSSLTTLSPPPGKWAVAYDIFISPKPQKGGTPTGTEVMLWLDTSGFKGTFSQWPLVTVSGHQWYLEHWWTHRANASGGWRLVILHAQGGGFSDLDVLSILHMLAAKGMVGRDWYVNVVEAGLEDWSGGNGFSLSKFAVGAC